MLAKLGVCVARTWGENEACISCSEVSFALRVHRVFARGPVPGSWEGFTSASSDVNLIGADVPSARQQADQHPPKSRLRAFGEFC